MGDSIGQILASAAGMALSPVALIAVVLMLATNRARTGAVFALAWTFALAAVVAVVLASTAGRRATAGHGAPATWTFWVQLGLGVLFLLLAVVEWRRRPVEGRPAETPAWMDAIETFTPGRAAALACVLAVANPKNIVLAAGGALSIAGTGAPVGSRVVAAAVMVVIGSFCTLVPLTVYFLVGARSVPVLHDWRAWMSAHSSAIVMTGLTVLGAKYLGEAVSGLSGR